MGRRCALGSATFPLLLFMAITGACATHQGKASPGIRNAARILMTLAPAAASKGKSIPAPVTPAQRADVAICLAGGLRNFSMTADSMATHLFPAFTSADVFVSAPLTHHSHEIALLAPALWGPQGCPHKWRLRALTFVSQSPINEADYGTHLLDIMSSPNGAQGLLQYFELTEGCMGMIEEAEAHQGYRCQWVLRTRPDGFWQAPPPPLRLLDPHAYNLPEGSSWFGHNDRLAIVQRDLAGPTVKRLSALKAMAAMPAVRSPRKFRKLTSERCLREQLRLANIRVNEIEVPFCTLSARVAPWPIRAEVFPIFALSSRQKLNGAYCRPCQPVLVGKESQAAVLRLRNGYGRPLGAGKKVGEGWEICHSGSPWDADWMRLFAEQAGAEAEGLREHSWKSAQSSCVADVESVLRFVGGGYKGPSAATICALRTCSRIIKGLSQKRVSLEGALHAVQTGGVPRGSIAVARGFPDLRKWRGKHRLVTPAMSGGAGSRDCFLLVPFKGDQSALSLKQNIVGQLEAQGWSTIRCGGQYTDQLCFFHGVGKCDDETDIAIRVYRSRQ